MRRVARSQALAVALLIAAGTLVGCSASSGTSSAGSAAGNSQAQPAADGAKAAGDTSAQAAADAAGRQVITTGTVQVTVTDPRAAAEQVVTLVERTGGRVDGRTETAAVGDQTARAHLTVRVPADSLTATVDALRAIGDIGQISISSRDVTADVQDLDARIRAMRVSVARMEDLLAKVTTTTDLVAAEQALQERQSNLETMLSQQARMAEQVALSTLDIDLTAPGAIPAAASPHGFWDGIVVGWQSLVVALRAVVLVVGVLLPWLAFAGVVAAVALLVVRRVRRHGAPAAEARADGTHGDAAPSGPTEAMSSAG